MKSNQTKTASFIIIGNEILSGRTIDQNLNFIAKELVELGIDLVESKIIRDNTEEIIKAVQYAKENFDYVFTSGGIGPTHDDITAEAIAQAFGVKLYRNPIIEDLLRNYPPKDKINEARLKMADIPEGSSLLNNPVTLAAGFKKENVFVFAGVPKIMQAMFQESKKHLEKGEPILSEHISVYAKEEEIAKILSEIQNGYPDLEIGSYPYIKDSKSATALVFRDRNIDKINQALKKLKAKLKNMKV